MSNVVEPSLETDPPRGAAKIVYLGPVAPHWEIRSDFGDRALIDAFRSGEAAVDPELDTLTAREREVLQLIARGYRYKEIAARLHLSSRTVESHVSAVLRKLQLSSRHELTRWANERRLL